MELLTAELYERLDDPALDDDLESCPVAHIIEDLRRDLGVAAQVLGLIYKRRTPADIRALCARAARPSTAPSRTVPLRPTDPLPIPTPPRHRPAGLLIRLPHPHR